jgi:hypothetical protein
MSLRIVFTPNAWQEYDGWLRHDLKMPAASAGSSSTCNAARTAPASASPNC